MNPVKLLASRNIIIAVGIFGIALIGLIVLQTRTGSAASMPSAERVGTPPEPAGDAVPLETVLVAFQRSRTSTLRQYRHSPLTAQVEAVTPVRKSGWAAAITLAGGRATAYVAEREWQTITPAIAVGQTRAFTCFDWQSGAGGTVTLYGCGVADIHQ